jgi:hypothetical protein
VTGVATATRTSGSARGLWITDPSQDADPRTSEGVFVTMGSAPPAVAVGDAVTTTGTVDEFYPGELGHPVDHQLTSAQWTVASGGNPLPGPTVRTEGSVPEELAPQPGGSVEALPLEPSKYSLDFRESHEGETVSVADTRIVGPTTSRDEPYVTTKPRQHPSARGGGLHLGYDRPNTGVLKVMPLIPSGQRPFPEANTGDTLTGVTSGPIQYHRFGGYTLLATTLGQVRDNGLRGEVTRKQRRGEPAVATYNVENLSVLDGQGRFDELAHGIVDNLAAPDVVTIEEIQDNNGTAGVRDGVVAADATLRRFVDAIVAAGGPRYEWREIDPQDATDGGAPGGNIRMGFLFNPARVSFVDRSGGDAMTPVAVLAGNARAAVHLARPRRPGEERMAGQPQAAGRRVRLPGPDGLRRGESLQLQGR